MEIKPKNIKNWKLALLFSAILSLFGAITNSLPQSDLNTSNILMLWFPAFGFLLAAWYLNSMLTNLFLFHYQKWNLTAKILIILPANGLLLMLFVLLNTLLPNSFQLERAYNYTIIIMKGTVSISIIYLIQYTLNLNAKNQYVLLQNQMLKTENIRAQFEILRQQISPHFLFNSLSSLRSMIRSSNKNAEQFVIKLTDIYRLLLTNKEIDTVPLKDELKFIDDYSFLLFARYENRLSIEIDIPQEMHNLKIPTFTLQLLLENCVKHNIVSKEKPLRIKVYNSGINSIVVENNLQPKSQTEEASGIGLQNLDKRYALLNVYNGVQIFSNESVYSVTIKLLEP